MNLHLFIDLLFHNRPRRRELHSRIVSRRGLTAPEGSSERGADLQASEGTRGTEKGNEEERGREVAASQLCSAGLSSLSVCRTNIANCHKTSKKASKKTRRRCVVAVSLRGNRFRRPAPCCHWRRSYRPSGYSSISDSERSMEEAETHIDTAQPKIVEIVELDSEPEPPKDMNGHEEKKNEQPQVIPDHPQKPPNGDIKTPEKPNSPESEPKSPTEPEKKEELADDIEPKCEKITLAGYTDGEDPACLGEPEGNRSRRPSDLALKDETKEKTPEASPVKSTRSSIPQEEEAVVSPKSPESPYIPERPTSPFEERNSQEPDHLEANTELRSPEEKSHTVESDLKSPETHIAAGSEITSPEVTNPVMDEAELKSPEESVKSSEPVKDLRSPEEDISVKSEKEEAPKPITTAEKPKPQIRRQPKGSLPSAVGKPPRPPMGQTIPKPKTVPQKTAPPAKTAAAHSKKPAAPSKIQPPSTKTASAPSKKPTQPPKTSASKIRKPQASSTTSRTLASAASTRSERGRSSSVKPVNGSAIGTPDRQASVPNTPKSNRRYVHVTSKINAKSDHLPQGGNVKIFSEKKTYSVTSKIGSLDNAKHVPGGGKVKIESVKTNFKDVAKPRVNDKGAPVIKASDKKIPIQKLNWKAESKVGSLENAKHVPAGGNVKILNKKTEWKAESKVGSKDNIKHVPGGGDKKIFHQPLKMNGVRSRIESTGSSTTPTRSRSRASTEDKNSGASTPCQVKGGPSRKSTGSASGCSTPLKMPGATDP
ncbi:hypothetical protein L596_023595 [Steinernema carpocapsae]|uniref:Microtubule-associated protein n=1 Tax=Steinernema carpocapsae TaxID=34508 RepID=A0A4V5ZZG9_STECR|nr:hypothetical protein L596_023595 [Steinernema carpocapsae]